MSSEINEKLDAMNEKLDRLLDPEHGIHARVAENKAAAAAALAAHEASDRLKHRTIYIILAVAASGAATVRASGLAELVIRLLS